MDVTKTVQELLLSKDKDNITIAIEMLKTYPTLIDITLHPLLNFYYQQDRNFCDGMRGNGKGGNIPYYFPNPLDRNYFYGEGCGSTGLKGNGASKIR